MTFSILLTSCATIMNQSHKSITIYTTEPSKIILNRDTMNTIDNKVNLKVESKKEPIKITASTDSLTKEFEVEPKNSFMSVSYTHLDVYKRQVLLLLKKSNWKMLWKTWVHKW